MATVRDSVIIVIGLESYRTDEIVAPVRTELKDECGSWNLLFLPVGRGEIANIPVYMDRHARDLDLIHVMNDADLTCNDVVDIATKLALALPKHPRNLMLSCELRLLRDIMNAQLGAAGIPLEQTSLRMAIKGQYARLRPSPQLRLISAA
jgi:hypothetical protein